MRERGSVVNDVHSRLNATRVHRIVRPERIDAVHSVSGVPSSHGGEGGLNGFAVAQQIQVERAPRRW